MFFRSISDDSKSIIDDSRSMINNCNEMHQIVASLTDDSRVIIYNQDIFIIQVKSLMFASKAGAKPSEAPFRCSILGLTPALPINISLGWKGLPGQTL
jgi:hypothetical protein